jgi:hypothetical protein
VAVEVVDLLEIVEVDHDQRDRLAALARRGDQPGGGVAEAASVQAAGERIGLGQQPRLLLGLASLVDLLAELAIAPPAEDDQRDVEQQGVGQRRFRPDAEPGQRAHDLRHDGSAGADEHDDGGGGDPQSEDVTIGLAEAGKKAAPGFAGPGSFVSQSQVPLALSVAA